MTWTGAKATKTDFRIRRAVYMRWFSRLGNEFSFIFALAALLNIFWKSCNYAIIRGSNTRSVCTAVRWVGTDFRTRKKPERRQKKHKRTGEPREVVANSGFRCFLRLRMGMRAACCALGERSPTNRTQPQRGEKRKTTPAFFAPQHSHTDTPRAWLSLSLAFSQQKLQDKSDVALKETGGSFQRKYIFFFAENTNRFLRTFHSKKKCCKDGGSLEVY